MLCCPSTGLHSEYRQSCLTYCQTVFSLPIFLKDSPLTNGATKLVTPNDSAVANFLLEDVALPAAVIRGSLLDSNIRWMQEFADSRSVRLAPHGKTTMCPQIFQKQLDAGAWGMTLATSAQVAVAAEYGVSRIIMANQLVGKQNMATVSEHLGSTEFYCLVDSVQNVRQLAEFFGNRHQSICVLIEIGVGHGRTGCRTDDEVDAVRKAIQESESVVLAGLEFYEGVIHSKNASIEVNALLDRVMDLTNILLTESAFETDDVILTGAGSAWYDAVTRGFNAMNLPGNVVPIIRPGSYVIHDSGMCNAFQVQILERSEDAANISGELKNSLEVLAYVQSVPEDDLAIVAMGKRDIGFSDGLPTPEWSFRVGNEKPKVAPTHWQVFEMMDQHTFLKIEATDNLEVGDMIAFSGSHPCLTCDKWRIFCLVDDHYRVVDRWPTFF